MIVNNDGKQYQQLINHSLQFLIMHGQTEERRNDDLVSEKVQDVDL